MRDYEMFDNDVRLGITNVYWKNINTIFKNSIISTKINSNYKILNNDESIQMYSLEYNIKDKDELYDIVSKYVEGDKERFIEIENIKKYNKIKKIKKNQEISILIPYNILSKFNLTTKDVDINSAINSMIYFINNVCENNNEVTDVKRKLDKLIGNFKNIINSIDYTFYLDSEKEKLKEEAYVKIKELIDIVENKTGYKYGKHYLIPLKIKCNK